jgi:hypothetical protein
MLTCHKWIKKVYQVLMKTIKKMSIALFFVLIINES